MSFSEPGEQQGLQYRPILTVMLQEFEESKGTLFNDSGC